MPQHVLVVDQVHDLDPLDCLGPDAALIAMACGTRRRSRAIREGLAAQRLVGAEAWRRPTSFMPSMASSERETRYRGWREAVAHTVLLPEV